MKKIYGVEPYGDGGFIIHGPMYEGYQEGKGNAAKLMTSDLSHGTTITR